MDSIGMELESVPFQLGHLTLKAIQASFKGCAGLYRICTIEEVEVQMAISPTTPTSPHGVNRLVYNSILVNGIYTRGTAGDEKIYSYNPELNKKTAKTTVHYDDQVAFEDEGKKEILNIIAKKERCPMRILFDHEIRKIMSTKDLVSGERNYLDDGSVLKTYSPSVFGIKPYGSMIYCYLSQKCGLLKPFKQIMKKLYRIHQGINNPEGVMPEKVLTFCISGGRLFGHHYDDVACNLVKAIREIDAPYRPVRIVFLAATRDDFRHLRETLDKALYEPVLTLEKQQAALVSVLESMGIIDQQLSETTETAPLALSVQPSPISSPLITPPPEFADIPVTTEAQHEQLTPTKPNQQDTQPDQEVVVAVSDPATVEKSEEALQDVRPKQTTRKRKKKKKPVPAQKFAYKNSEYEQTIRGCSECLSMIEKLVNQKQFIETNDIYTLLGQVVDTCEMAAGSCLYDIQEAGLLTDDQLMFFYELLHIYIDCHRHNVFLLFIEGGKESLEVIHDRLWDIIKHINHTLQGEYNKLAAMCLIKGVSYLLAQDYQDSQQRMHFVLMDSPTDKGMKALLEQSIPQTLPLIINESHKQQTFFNTTRMKEAIIADPETAQSEDPKAIFTHHPCFSDIDQLIHIIIGNVILGNDNEETQRIWKRDLIAPAIKDMAAYAARHLEAAANTEELLAIYERLSYLIPAYQVITPPDDAAMLMLSSAWRSAQPSQNVERHVQPADKATVRVTVNKKRITILSRNESFNTQLTEYVKFHNQFMTEENPENKRALLSWCYQTLPWIIKLYTYSIEDNLETGIFKSVIELLNKLINDLTYDLYKQIIPKSDLVYEEYEQKTSKSGLRYGKVGVNRFIGQSQFLQHCQETLDCFSHYVKENDHLRSAYMTFACDFYYRYLLHIESLIKLNDIITFNGILTSFQDVELNDATIMDLIKLCVYLSIATIASKPDEQQERHNPGFTGREIKKERKKIVLALLTLCNRKIEHRNSYDIDTLSETCTNLNELAASLHRESFPKGEDGQADSELSKTITSLSRSFTAKHQEKTDELFGL